MLRRVFCAEALPDLIHPSPPPDSAIDRDQLLELEHDAQHVADELPEPATDRTGRRLRRWIKWGVAAIVLALVGRALAQQLLEATAQEVSFRWPYALLSGVALMGLYGSLMASERSLLWSFAGVRLPWRHMMAVAWVPLAGKYVPGKFAAVAGAVVLLRRVGVSTGVGLSIFVILDAMPILTGAMLSGLLAFNDELRAIVNRQAPAAWGVLGVVVAIGLICIQPPIFGRTVNLALRLLRRPPLPHVPRLRDYLSPAMWSLGQWAGNAGSVFLMCVAFAPRGMAPGLSELPDVIGITALVMCASYFSAFLTPSGLGVREALLLPLLSTILPTPAAAAVTIAMRLAHTLVEIILCGIGLLMLRRMPEGGGRAKPFPNDQAG